MWLNGCRNLTKFVSCDIWSDSSSDDETAGSSETPAQYQQLPIEDNSTRIGSNSGSQERTHKEEVHIC